MIFDTHAHLNDERLVEEVDAIAAGMENDNLCGILTVGYDRASSERGYKISQKHEKIYCAVGIHPHDAKSANRSDYDYFSTVSKDKKCVAYGEIGLDFYYDLSPREVQEKVFLEQLELAHSLRMPVILHLRDAYALMNKLLVENKKKLEYGAVLHCYSGSREMLGDFNKLDLFYSFGGAVTFKNATEKPTVIRDVPAEKLLLETDCPYMTPVPFRGKINYPKYVNLVAEKIAEILGKDINFVGDISTQNAKMLFKKIEE